MTRSIFKVMDHSSLATAHLMLNSVFQRFTLGFLKDSALSEIGQWLSGFGNSVCVRAHVYMQIETS